MAIHRLRSVTLAVPDPDACLAFYEDFGLAPEEDGWLASTDGGRQLRLVAGAHRSVALIEIGADDQADLDRIQGALRQLEITTERDGQSLSAIEPVTDITVRVVVEPRLDQPERQTADVNGPGRADRTGRRADVLDREGPVLPRRLGHVVIGSPDYAQSAQFFTDGIGFKLSDSLHDAAVFLRCSTDHHNVMLLRAPVTYPHHTSWQVDDVDEVGRGAMQMLDRGDDRHVWGPGRHIVGSNYFWYLLDPAGTYAEYYADGDVIVDDAEWVARGWDGATSLYEWGPPPPPTFLAPADLDQLVAP